MIFCGCCVGVVCVCGVGSVWVRVCVRVLAFGPFIGGHHTRGCSSYSGKAWKSLLLFRVADVLYHYRVCHFGARFSAYWWQRAGAFLLRLLHGILGLRPHRAWLFVDDLLAALRRSDADAQLALMVMFFAAISAPISWKKVQFQDSLTWCGWRINFLHETIELTPEKTIKLKGQLHELLKAGKVKRKLLEQVLGLLIWATSSGQQCMAFLCRQALKF